MKSIYKLVDLVVKVSGFMLSENKTVCFHKKTSPYL